MFLFWFFFFIMRINKSINGLFETELSMVGSYTKVRAVFDTGASRSSVPTFVINTLKLNPTGNFDIIMDASGHNQFLLTYNMTFIIDGKQIDFEPTIRSIPFMLIGMDIISQGKLVIENNVLEFTV